MANLKILVCGDVNGKFDELFNRVRKVNQKAGPFHSLFVCGNFFPREYIPDLEIPRAVIPTFILGPVCAEQLAYYPDIQGCNIRENIVYLGRSGVYNEVSGLKIAYMSGVEHDGLSSTKKEYQFNFEDVKNLRIRLENEASFKGVDILITSQWPKDVDNGTNVKPDEKPNNATSLVSVLAKSLKPRYHFAGMEDISYERPPYRNHEVLAESVQHVSRFISLAYVGNSKKKWMYAFNITPMKEASKEVLYAEPANVTSNPFSSSSLADKPGAKAVGAPPPSQGKQFFYDSSYIDNPQLMRGRGKRNHHGHFDGNRPPKGPKRPFQPAACWFCLASPEVAKHLVISIGEAAYLTLAKGGLTDDHLLILPIGHFQSLVECPMEVVEEITKFKTSLIKYFNSVGKDVIFYERNFKSPHLQVQVVPIPKPKSTGLKITCLDYAESEGIEMQDFPRNSALFQMTRPGFPYFYMELPDCSKLFVAIKKEFPIQFGRELLASEPILNCPDKIDWKKCTVDKAEEIQLVEQIRNGFKPYDFTVE